MGRCGSHIAFSHFISVRELNSQHKERLTLGCRWVGHTQGSTCAIHINALQRVQQIPTFVKVIVFTKGVLELLIQLYGHLSV